MSKNRNNRSYRPDTYESHSSSKRKKMPVSVGRAVLLTLSILFVALGAFTVVAYQYMFAPLTVKAIDRSASALGIASNAQDDMKETGVINIALFGVDSRDESSDDGRSDSMIILSIDKTHSKIKLTSILRDSYVPIDGHGKEKITHAYAYGGAPLALRTLNENYNMDIQDYMTVNFAQFANLIDSVGGIDMDISGGNSGAKTGCSAYGGRWHKKPHVKSVYCQCIEKTGDLRTYRSNCNWKSHGTGYGTGRSEKSR